MRKYPDSSLKLGRLDRVLFPTPITTGPVLQKHSYWIVIIGLLVVTVTFSVSVWKWTTAGDVATVMGSVTGVVGTLVGAVSRLQDGKLGKREGGRGP